MPHLFSELVSTIFYVGIGVVCALLFLSLAYVLAILAFTSASTDSSAENVVVETVIISELKLRDVQRQVFWANLVERSDHAALNQRPETFDGVGVDRADDILTARMVDSGVREVFVEVLVADPLIGAEQANLGRYRFADKLNERRCLHVFDNASDDIAFTTNCPSDDCLTRSASAVSTAALILVPVFGFATDGSFIYLDNASKFFKVAVSERSTDAVAHIPSRLVRTEAKETENLKGAHPLFARQHKVDNAKPILQRLIGVLKDCACNVRETVARLRGALVALPVPRIVLQLSGLRRATAGAMDAFRPSLADQISAAGFLIREKLVELCRRQLVDLLFGCHCLSLTMEGI